MPLQFLPSDRPIYEVSAAFVATVAYPTPSEAEARDVTRDCICAWWIRVAQEKGWPIGLANAEARHIELADKGAKPGKRFDQKMARRQQAFALELPRLLRKNSIDVLPLRNGKPARPNALAEEASILGWGNDRSDQRDYIIRPSLSVMHALAALRITQVERNESGEAFDFRSMYSDPSLIDRVVRYAEALEPLVLDCWGGKVPEDDLWRFRGDWRKLPPTSPA